MWCVSTLCDTWHSLTFSYHLVSISFLIKKLVLKFHFYRSMLLMPWCLWNLKACKLRFLAANGNVQVAQRLDLSEFLPTIVPLRSLETCREGYYGGLCCAASNLDWSCQSWDFCRSQTAHSVLQVLGNLGVTGSCRSVSRCGFFISRPRAGLLLAVKGLHLCS